MSDLKYPQSVFLPEVHEEVQLFYSRSLGYCFGIKKTELEDLKKELGIKHFYQLESGSQIKLYKLGVIPPFITDVIEYINVDDLEMIDENWQHRSLK